MDTVTKEACVCCYFLHLVFLGTLLPFYKSCFIHLWKVVYIYPKYFDYTHPLLPDPNSPSSPHLTTLPTSCLPLLLLIILSLLSDSDMHTHVGPVTKAEVTSHIPQKSDTFFPQWSSAVPNASAEGRSSGPAHIHAGLF